MRFIHTSDWHLGHVLASRKRYDEFEHFLDWLARTIQQEAADCLLVAGDIFDSGTPSNRAQELYYRFLGKVALGGCCRHVVVVGGNHDSPSLLQAPRDLLAAVNVHVVASAAEDPAAELLLLSAPDGSPQALVCAVPFLRDRDLRSAEAGESQADKERKVVEGLAAHYQQVVSLAEARRAALGRPDLPILGLGHLFAAGGQVGEADGSLPLYIGSLGQVPASVFPKALDYLALGHLHRPQQVAGLNHLRYCGSPIPLWFTEGGVERFVLKVELATAGAEIQVTPLQLPRIRRLASLRGDLPTLLDLLAILKSDDLPSWVELVYDGAEIQTGLRQVLEKAVEGSLVEVLQVRDQRRYNLALASSGQQETLDDLGPAEVFQRCLTDYEVPTDQQARLTQAFQEILAGLQTADHNAE